MGKGEDDKKEGAAPCQLLPGGFAGTGPNGSFFETPGWVDKVSRLSVFQQMKVCEDFTITEEGLLLVETT